MRKVLSVLAFLLFVTLIFGTAAFAEATISADIKGESVVQPGKTITLTAELLPGVDENDFRTMRWTRVPYDGVLVETPTMRADQTIITTTTGVVGDKDSFKVELISSDAVTIVGESAPFEVTIIDIPMTGIKLDKNIYLVDTNIGHETFTLLITAEPNDTTIWVKIEKIDPLDVLDVLTPATYPIPNPDGTLPTPVYTATTLVTGNATVKVSSVLSPDIFAECKVFVFDSTAASPAKFIPTTIPTTFDFTNKSVDKTVPLFIDVDGYSSLTEAECNDPKKFPNEADLVTTFMPGIKSTDLYVNSEGLVTIKDSIAKEIAMDLLGVDSADVITLPVFEAILPFLPPPAPANTIPDGHTAAIMFKVDWDVLSTNGYVRSPKDVKLLKILSATEGKLFEYVEKVADVADGKFTLLVADVGAGRTPPYAVYDEVDSSDIIYETFANKYFILFGIKDGGSFDLDGENNGVIWDPMALASIPVTDVKFKNNPLVVNPDEIIDLGKEIILVPDSASVYEIRSKDWDIDPFVGTFDAADHGILTVNPHLTSQMNTVISVDITVKKHNGNDVEFKQVTCVLQVRPAAASITVTPDTANVAIGKTLQLASAVLPTDADQTVTWDSSNKLLATVDSDGLVTGVAAGYTLITATTYNGIVGQCLVTVTVPDPISAVAVTPKTETLNTSSKTTVQLTAVVTPSTADQSVTWTSGNSAVATVSATGLVTAVSDGTAVITATASDGVTKDTCTITVDSAPTVLVTGVTLDKTTLDLIFGGDPNDASYHLTATIDPPTATNKNVTWLSSAPSVVSVTGTLLDGLVTALAPGSATVTVTTADGGKTAVCNVTVTAAPTVVPVDNLTLNKHSENLINGETLTLTATITPSNATNKDVIWSSSNSSIVSVPSTSANTITVTASAVGSATITATAAGDSTKTDSCTIIVSIPDKPIMSVTVSPAPLTMDIAQSRSLTATVLPVDTTESRAVTWTSSNPSVASVTGSGANGETGLVTGHAVGTATITASAGSCQGHSNVTVKKPDPLDPTFPTDPKDVADKTGISSGNFEVKGNLVYLKKALAEAIAKVLLGTSKPNVSVSPVFEGDMAARGFGAEGQVAEIKLEVLGADLLAMFADDIILIGLTSSNTGKKFTFTADSNKFEEKTFTLLLGGVIYTGKIDPNATYELVVFIRDGGEFDLTGKANGEVVAQVFFAADGSSSGGGGGCNAGFLALMMLAVPFVLRRKQ
ncbi:MAG: Ig-like domain-containing protein [Synergistaceae bacterium]|nr:Ig-like domain-containing protein [Synergistaceae bacterium]